MTKSRSLWLVLLLVGCGPVELATADATCLVAQGDGFSITLAEVDALRQQQGPALGRAQAGRLAVDATVAHWMNSGDVQGSAPEKLESLRAQAVRLSKLPDAERRRALAEARHTLNVQHGPCFRHART